MSTREKKKRELELWKEWKQAKGKRKNELLEELLKATSPIIYKEVNKWARAPIPTEIIETKAKVLAVKAFETFDPQKGVALSTHLTNQLKPLSRLIYTHQNVARIPSEARIAKINTLKNIIETYRINYGRDPTIEELSDELGLPPRQIEKFLKELHPDFLASAAIAPFAAKFDLETDTYIRDFYLSLSPKEKLVFEYSTGYGKKQLPIEEIAARTGMSVYEVRKMREDLAARLKAYLDVVSPVMMDRTRMQMDNVYYQLKGDQEVEWQSEFVQF